MAADAVTAHDRGLMIDTDNEPSPLQALLDVARRASEEPLEQFLWTVAERIHAAAGYGTVVVNVYRPAWGDYEVVAVVGAEGAMTALLETSTPGSMRERAAAAEAERLPGVFFISADSPLWADVEAYTPDRPASDDPDHWQAEDGLIVFLHDSEGRPLAFLSLDEPASGKRPTDEELQLIRAISDHVEHALESARRAEDAVENQRILRLLLEASPALAACTTEPELLTLAAGTVVPELGFERFAGYCAGDQRLGLCAARGWEPNAGLAASLDPQRVTALLSSELTQAGCYLIKATTLFGDAAEPSTPRSARNGHGPGAWDDHCLVVPLIGSDEALAGLIVIEDPRDRLLPRDDRRRAVRLLADQVSGALISIEQRVRLNHLATHDELTGLRNRRGLADIVAGRRNVALLICDLDHFKQVNDRHGHEAGDRVLSRFGGLLGDHARAADVPMRLGGDEFCLVLPDTGRDGALRLAERLRQATARAFEALAPGGITVSIGVATSAHAVADAETLLAAADRGLYAAKAAGRNRRLHVTVAD